MDASRLATAVAQIYDICHVHYPPGTGIPGTLEAKRAALAELIGDLVAAEQARCAGIAEQEAANLIRWAEKTGAAALMDCASTAHRIAKGIRGEE